jgi:hypothetical protein
MKKNYFFGVAVALGAAALLFAEFVFATAAVLEFEDTFAA